MVVTVQRPLLLKKSATTPSKNALICSEIVPNMPQKWAQKNLIQNLSSARQGRFMIGGVGKREKCKNEFFRKS